MERLTKTIKARANPPPTTAPTIAPVDSPPDPEAFEEPMPPAALVNGAAVGVDVEMSVMPGSVKLGRVRCYLDWGGEGMEGKGYTYMALSTSNPPVSLHRAKHTAPGGRLRVPLRYRDQL